MNHWCHTHDKTQIFSPWYKKRDVSTLKLVEKNHPILCFLFFSLSLNKTSVLCLKCFWNVVNLIRNVFSFHIHTYFQTGIWFWFWLLLLLSFLQINPIWLRNISLKEENPSPKKEGRGLNASAVFHKDTLVRWERLQLIKIRQRAFTAQTKCLGFLLPEISSDLTAVRLLTSGGNVQHLKLQWCGN